MPDKQILFSNYLQNYNLHWIEAKKFHNAGRASGGCLYGYREELRKLFNLKFSNLSNGNVVLTARLNNELFYFIPRYLNCTNWNADFESFENFLNDICPTNFCIVGDLNARIGEGQYILDTNLLTDLPHVNKIRCFKDKVTNSQGKRLMDFIENIGGIVVNGRMDGDAEGELSFYGGRGNSLIDYCICSQSFLMFFEDFKIDSKPYSDHMPIDFKLNLPVTNNTTLRPDFRPQKIHWNRNNAAKYIEKLNQLSCTSSFDQYNNSVDTLVLQIKNKIRDAIVLNKSKFSFEPKQKWFNWNCFRSRRKMLKKLKKFRKKHSCANKLKYMSSKSKHLNVCRNSEIKYYNSNLNKLNNIRCSKEWWKLSNGLKSRSYSIRGDLTADDFLQHFSSILQNSNTINTFDWCMPYKVDAFLDSPFELCELNSVLKNLKDNKSPGQDGISYEFFKYAPENFINEVLYVLNVIFLKENIPASFKTAILIPLLKKGDPNIPSNYRGLSLIDTLCKIFNSILMNRITYWIDENNILNEYQAGFRKQYSTVDNVFNLTNIVQLNKLNGKNTYAFFVDFTCAFDLIPRNSLFYKLANMGLSSKIIRILQQSYDNTSSQIFFRNSLSNSFNVYLGVKQGCILSPILFALYLNDLDDALTGGVTVGNITVKVLMYADDIVLLSDSPVGLQMMINSLHVYSNLWHLKVNLAKSKVLVFRSGTRISNNLKWMYGENEIDIVNSYKYLGMDLCYNLSFSKHLENKLTTSKMAISSSWSKYINHPKIYNKNKLKIFGAVSRSIMFYGAQIWGYRKYDIVEKLFRFFIKKMLLLPSNTPNYMLYLETGLHSLYIDTLKLHFDYINKVLNMPYNRLPRKLANMIIAKHTFWAEDWTNLCSKINFVPENNSVPLSNHCKSILPLVKIYENQNYISDARNSQSHDLYSRLNYSLLQITITELSSRAISLLIRARGGLLDINARSFRSTSVEICTLCNLDATENTLHLIGSCPIYNGFRNTFFNKHQLNLLDVLNILNGDAFDFGSLVNYLESCLKYRKLILNEFAS